MWAAHVGVNGCVNVMVEQCTRCTLCRTSCISITRRANPAATFALAAVVLREGERKAAQYINIIQYQYQYQYRIYINNESRNRNRNAHTTHNDARVRL